MREAKEVLLEALAQACKGFYGDRLLSLVIFGSYGRETEGPDSDLDFLLVARGLPDGRMPRVEEFCTVEHALGTTIREAWARGNHVTLSPHFKTPEEASRGSILYLDMVEDAKLLVDRNGFFASILDSFRDRLASLGARRIWSGSRWYWDLKPDFRPGTVIEL
jgi:predicted nucleotidyltransferase